ncbi:MAG: hypothetical protein ACXVB9_02330 [Bdellovibrionota bacterium]
MSKKPRDHTRHTKTTDFEVDGIEEAYAPARSSKSWQQSDLPSLQVEKPPPLRAPIEHSAKIWILERRARGWMATVKRWLIGKSRR